MNRESNNNMKKEKVSRQMERFTYVWDMFHMSKESSL